MDYNEIFRLKTKLLAIDIIEAFSSLGYSDAISVIRKQIIRAVTSIAANYRALGRSRSEQERFAKLSLVVEEADEVLFWLELAQELKLLPAHVIEELMIKAEEILKATASYRKCLSGG